MPIGTLYLDIPRQAFIPVNTLLGTLYVTPVKGHVLEKGDFEVELNQDLAAFTTPVKYYNVLGPRMTKRVGYGFLCPIVEPEVLDYGLIYRYSRRMTGPPELIHRSSDFCIYHAPNSATIITIPTTISEIEELLLAI
jgi:hypothetical protein